MQVVDGRNYKMHKIVYSLTTLFIPIALTTNNAPLTFLSLLQIKYALDHEGRAVGEGCCGGKRQALSKKVATYLSFVLRHAEVSILNVGKQVTSV